MQLKKLILIAIKDLKLIFRDPSALVLMLMAPFLLTLGMGAVTGGFSRSGNSGISDIPVEIINQDQGILGKTLVEVFQSPELDDLVAPRLRDELDEAKNLVDEGNSAAVIFIPEGFTESIIPGMGQSVTDNVLQIELYENPTAPTSVGIVRSILDQFLNQVEIGRVSSEVIITQLIQYGIISPQQAGEIGAQIGAETAQSTGSGSAIKVITNQAEEEGIAFNILAYLAPGMAMMFLMYTVTYGAHSLLYENAMGTLPRMLVTPTLSTNILAGKMMGIFLTAITQLLILIGGTSLLFRLEWGDTVGVILLILAAAFSATGWGIFFAAILKTPGQISITGSAVMLLFGLLGGSFFDLSMLPDWIRVVNKITPNAWAIDGFYILSLGGKLQDIQTNLLALVIMGVALFLFASFWLNKRGLARK
jgi:ABC-2 type transport system permease protein